MNRQVLRQDRDLFTWAEWCTQKVGMIISRVRALSGVREERKKEKSVLCTLQESKDYFL